MGRFYYPFGRYAALAGEPDPYATGTPGKPQPAVYPEATAGYVIDAPAFLYLVDAGLDSDPARRLVAPSSIRSEGLELLLRDVRAGQRTGAEALAAVAQDAVPVAAVAALAAPG